MSRFDKAFAQCFPKRATGLEVLVWVCFAGGFAGGRMVSQRRCAEREKEREEERRKVGAERRWVLWTSTGTGTCREYGTYKYSRTGAQVPT